ncbi:DUF4239 domain-containing protein [Solihabitans fulvus]|uniref:DUF4239 domain-containing protein n=1 Tax=Solihabitans fulvus TaxID=1892852 RepID=A0A5B2WR14_9PSEU|nr:DUF4239 domain-containing protein [Solihabitans fulvus]KAA2253945.1 DUF4239 domain-containing protein [Solihabitans fulvus]
MTEIVIWCLVVAAAAAVLILSVAMALKGATVGERRERWQDQTTAPVGAMLNAMFLAAFGLSLVIAWQSYDRARTHLRDESAALTRLYDVVGALPAHDDLRGGIRDYTRRLVDREWPELQLQRSDEAADALAGRLTTQVLALQATTPAEQSARALAVGQWNTAADARQSRIGDTLTGLPWGLLLAVVVTAFTAIGHAMIVGLPHTSSSLISLLAEGVVIAVAVYVLFLIRSPYHGALDLPPDQLRLVLARFGSAH